MKKVLLVRPISQYYFTVAPNLGLGYLAASLRNAGHEVSLLDCDKERMTPERFGAFLRQGAFDMVGFQLYTNCLGMAARQVRIARQALPHATLIAGGPHASGDPQQTLSFLGDIDALVIGEGEAAIVDLARLDRGQIRDASRLAGMRNVACRGADGAPVCAPVGPVADLDAIPMPAWDLIDPRTYPWAPHGTFARAFPIAPIVTSRGCPYACTFCASFRIHGRKMRRRSPRAVLDEIEYLVKRYGVREIHIEDDNFTMGKEYAREVLSGIIARGIRIWIALPNGVRIDALDGDLLRLMERAGCYSFGIGIESGSDRILKSLQKALTVREIEEKTALVKRHTKIRMTGFFLIGHPEETEDDIRASIALALRLKLDRVSFSPLMPLPGSRIYDEWKARVDPAGAEWEKFLYYQFIPSLSPIRKERLEQLLKRANISFYLRPRIIWGLLSEVKTPYQLKMLARRAGKILAG